MKLNDDSPDLGLAVLRAVLVAVWLVMIVWFR